MHAGMCTDPLYDGLLTIVNQDDHASALQVQNAAGEWVDAPPMEGSFVCNIGDMLQIWTNGRGAIFFCLASTRLRAQNCVVLRVCKSFWCTKYSI